ncbi:VOC family protein [Methylocapsa sp. S129]|uniref:bleomycin resistance protein n=1 Tax=Methylocapsa sp. S129 TaxID=1641869 RepID=UPI00131CCD8A|nr:VOC family protein [Methylocapsa sp. S129]
MPNWARLVPELLVGNIDASLRFWCDLLGFVVAYDRPEQGFAYLDCDGAQLMLEQRDDRATRWRTGTLEYPLGRGVNFEIEVSSLRPIIARLEEAGWPLFMACEEKWYRAGNFERGQLQFLVQDPDGYLVRLMESIGERPVAGRSP